MKREKSRIRKRITYGVLLALTVILTSGCGQKDSGQEKKSTKTPETESGSEKMMGRYVEREITLSGEAENPSYASMQEGEDGIILYIGSHDKEKKFQVARYQLGEDETVRKEDDLKWLADIRKEEGKDKSDNLRKVFQGEDGNEYALFRIYGKNYHKYELYRCQKGENAGKKIEIPMLDEVASEEKEYTSYTWVSDCEVLENGNVVLQLGGTRQLALFSFEGKKLGDIDITFQTAEEGGNGGFTVKGNYVYGLKGDGSGILVYDGEAAEEVETIDYTLDKTGVCLQVLPDETLLAADRKGISLLKKDGTIWQNIVDGALNSMGMPTMYIRGMAAREGEKPEYTVLYNSSEGETHLMKYVFDGTVTAVPEKELNVYSLRENSLIRQAVSLYQQKNQNVKVNYTVAMTEDETGNTSDYIRALNTELLNGNGADILILDGLPVDSYMEKGVLEDLTNTLKPIQDALLSNITAAYTKEGKIYQLPTRVAVPVIFGEKAAAEAGKSLADMAAFAKEHPDKRYFLAWEEETFVRAFLEMDGDSLFDSAGGLDKEAFRAFLENIQYMKESGALEDKGEEYRTNMLFTNPYLLIKKKIYTATETLNDTWSLFMVEALIKDVDYVLRSIGNKFYASGSIGLNAASKETELAGEFIQYLYSNEIQKINLYNGFPIERKALEKWLLEVPENAEDISFSSSINDGEGSDETISGGYPSEEIRKAVLSLIEELSAPVSQNEILNDMIIEQLAGFLDGSLDIDETLNATAQKVNTYLSE